MKILVLGATGPLGKEILQLAKERSFEVAALARHPEALAGIEGIEVHKGDLFEVESLKRAMKGVDAVVSAYGIKLTRKPTTLISDGTKNMVKAMKEMGVERFVCVTGAGAGDSKGHAGFLFDRVLEPLLLHEIYADKTRQEEVVRGSGLAWTIVRPAVLTNGGYTGDYQTPVNMDGFKGSKISRKDVADFLLKEVKEGNFVRKSPVVSY